MWPHPLRRSLSVPTQDLPVRSIIVACLLLAAITFLIALGGRRFRYLPVGWFWFIGTMVPMIGLVQVGWQAFADRYTYIPSVGIFIVLVWLVADAIEDRKWGRAITVAGALIIFPALALTTLSQLPYWKDDLTLFEHALVVTSENPLAQYHVGDDLIEMGRYSEAIPHLEEMIRLRPSFYAGYYSLGKAQAGVGLTEVALRNFSEALRFRTKYPEGYYARAVARLQVGDVQGAELDFRSALKFADSTPNTQPMRTMLSGTNRSRNVTIFWEPPGCSNQAVRLNPKSVCCAAEPRVCSDATGAHRGCHRSFEIGSLRNENGDMSLFVSCSMIFNETGSDSRSS